jgi:hypothetical protein
VDAVRRRLTGALDLVTGVTNSSRVEVFENPMIVIARRDDHKPFFQIS